VYADTDILLLDDPISALDAKVGKKVFEQVLRGMCKNKTIVLATHAIDYLN
jgi:ATP-binding cassette, subfamily C (CFTR/MRP), member 4